MLLAPVGRHQGAASGAHMGGREEEGTIRSSDVFRVGVGCLLGEGEEGGAGDRLTGEIGVYTLFM
jgi:hypothetical protein